MLEEDHTIQLRRGMRLLRRGRIDHAADTMTGASITKRADRGIAFTVSITIGF